MKLKEFIKVLEDNSGKELKFEYAKNQLAGANYHLTEVKNVQFDTTDCGGKTNFWKETQFQLWESPSELDKTDYMTTDKIHDILKRVDSIKPLWLETVLKIEYGNKEFPTSVMPIESILISNEDLMVQLYQEETRCKANAVCGFVEEEQEIEKTSCCTETSCC